MKFKVGDKIKIEVDVVAVDEKDQFQPVRISHPGCESLVWLRKEDVEIAELVERPREPGWYVVMVAKISGVYCRYWDGGRWAERPDGPLACLAHEEADVYSWISERIEMPGGLAEGVE